MKRLLLVLFMCVSIYGANDFSGDANCKALWRFEDGALTTDSKGTNTLTNSGAIADTSRYQEGAASADFEESDPDYMTIADGDLDAGFPLKNGDATKKISVCFWFRSELLPANDNEYRVLCSKYHHTDNKRSFAIIYQKSAAYGQDLILQLGHTSGNNAESLWLDRVELAVDTWYHVGVTYQDSDKSYHIRLWDDSGSTNYDRTGTATNNINIEDASWTIGNYSSLVAGVYHAGLIDEMVVFNDILSSAEIDQIRGGTYGASSTNAQVIIIGGM